jgi:hypothetical protein
MSRRARHGAPAASTSARRRRRRACRTAGAQRGRQRATGSAASPAQRRPSGLQPPPRQPLCARPRQRPCGGARRARPARRARSGRAARARWPAAQQRRSACERSQALQLRVRAEQQRARWRAFSAPAVRRVRQAGAGAVVGRTCGAGGPPPASQLLTHRARARRGRARAGADERGGARLLPSAPTRGRDGSQALLQLSSCCAAIVHAALMAGGGRAVVRGFARLLRCAACCLPHRVRLAAQVVVLGVGVAAAFTATAVYPLFLSKRRPEQARPWHRGAPVLSTRERRRRVLSGRRLWSGQRVVMRKTSAATTCPSCVVPPPCKRKVRRLFGHAQKAASHTPHNAGMWGEMGK